LRVFYFDPPKMPISTFVPELNPDGTNYHAIDDKNYELLLYSRTVKIKDKSFDHVLNECAQLSWNQYYNYVTFRDMANVMFGLFCTVWLVFCICTWNYSTLSSLFMNITLMYVISTALFVVYDNLVNLACLFIFQALAARRVNQYLKANCVDAQANYPTWKKVIGDGWKQKVKFNK